MSSSTIWDDDNAHNHHPGPHDFTRAEVITLIYIAMSLSAVSAISQVFIIATFWKFPRLHTFAYKVIMMLAVANLCLDAAYLIGNVGHDNWRCTVQGFARVYFSLVEFGLITSITLTCYLMIVKHEFSIQERFRSVMAWCWSVPLVMAALPFSTDSYGDAGAWCSITARDLKSLEWGTFWRFSIIYVPLWVAVAINGYMCYRVYMAIKGFEAAMVVYDEPLEEPDTRSASPDTEWGGPYGGGGWGTSGRRSGGAAGGGGRSSRSSWSSTSMGIVNRLRLYPIALVVCWSWATVNRLREAIDPYGAIFWLYILQYSFQTIHGFLNLIIFLRTPAVMEEWRDEVKKLSICRLRSSSVDRSALLRNMSTGESTKS